MTDEDEIYKAAWIIWRELSSKSDLTFEPACLAREILAPHLALEAELRGFITDLQADRDQWRARVKELLVENATLRNERANFEQVICDVVDELGCSHDNDEIIKAIAALRKRLVIDDAMVERAFIGFYPAKAHLLKGDPALFADMRAALEAAIGEETNETPVIAADDVNEKDPS